MFLMRRLRTPRSRCCLVAALIAAAACKRTAPRAAPNTPVSPETHKKFPIASGVHAVACDTCHGDFPTFQQFTCFNCHAHDRTLTDELHRSVAAGAPGYAYASTSCLSCHASGGRVGFDHAGITSPCATCHDSGAQFDPLPVAGRGLDGGTFGHPDKHGNDCASCHVVASWLDAKGLPDGVRDPGQDLVVQALVPSYAGTSIAAVSAQAETLPMPMFHSSATVPPSFGCAVCHSGATTGAFFPGRLHASLGALPSTCLDCHATSAPTGFVGPLNAGRTPPTGEMKHDAVLWIGGARTRTPAVTQDCSACHRSASTWVTSQGFHASVAVQPASCLDCHANSRPGGLLTSANAALPAGVQFDHSTATGECTTCHGGSFSSWTSGRLHLAGSATPSSCLPCHQGERPTSTAGWMSSTFPASPFDYATHGTREDCAACHTGPGTGSWGATQNWVGGNFGHGPTSTAATTCVACHATQRPDLVLGQSRAASLLPGNFDHAVSGTADCYSCHQATKTYLSYFDASGTLPGGDWSGGVGPLDGASDPSRDVALTAQVPSYAGTSITALTAQAEALPMPMFHSSPTVPPAVACASCHADATAGVFFPGRMHASLLALNAAPPQTCLDCHATSAPTGFVGPTDAARTPPSPQMKHDAVLWSGGSPTATPAVPQECSLCHFPPPFSFTWATSQKFHGSLPAPPSSCLDCHANSRPAAPLTSDNAPLPAGVQFDHSTGTALGECATCHTGDYTSWANGQFHVAGSATPSSCLPCHGRERPTSTGGWISPTYADSPFDYVTNAAGVTHGAGQDCVVCHAGPGTGSWGGTQDWVAGSFSHAASLVAGSTCIACHSTQRPDLVLGESTAAALLPGNFDHALGGTGDCLGCHAATVAANAYLNYFGPSGTLPGGDWRGGVIYPGSTLISAPGQVISVDETILNRAGPGDLVTGASTISVTLYEAMLHVSTALPPELSAGPTDHPDFGKCWHCHTNDNGTVTSYTNGLYHASLDGYRVSPGAPVTPLPQPANQCSDCHVQTRPGGIVEWSGSGLQPMDHDAMFVSGAVASANQIDCSSCHRRPGSTWADGAFHARVAPAVPQDCTVCHYPLMADRAKADATSGVSYTMRHQSAQLGFQNCQVCHLSALSNGTATPLAAMLWRPGAFHSSVAPQPLACNDCHAPISQPVAATQSPVSYPLAAGATSSNQGQWMNHASPAVVGKDCAACHAADAAPGVTAWNTADSLHAAVTPHTCGECHGLNNGGGSELGRGNNLPAGLTDSATVSSAAGDGTSGVPAGTHDRITHSDLNVGLYDCNFCHLQAGASNVAGIEGHEWAQASFHASFSASSPLTINGTTARCSNCHLNLKPPAGFTVEDHSPFSAAPGTFDCSSCHSWPGTGTTSAANWLGGSGFPQSIPVGGFTVPAPPAAAPVVQGGIDGLPHPAVNDACTACHTSVSGGRPATGYDHASALINSNCNACHEAGSDLVGTPWNGATAESAGAGDTRPFTLPSVYAAYSGNSHIVAWPDHFYSSGTKVVDCKECHAVPAGYGTTTTGNAYLKIGSAGLSSTGVWAFPHNQSAMTYPDTCQMCHGNNIPH